MENFDVWFDRDVSVNFEKKIKKHSALGEYQEAIKLFRLIENRYEIANNLNDLETELFLGDYRLAKEEVVEAVSNALISAKNNLDYNIITGDVFSFVSPENQDHPLKTEFFESFRYDVKHRYLSVLRGLLNSKV